MVIAEDVFSPTGLVPSLSYPQLPIMLQVCVSGMKWGLAEHVGAISGERRGGEFPWRLPKRNHERDIRLSTSFAHPCKPIHAHRPRHSLPDESIPKDRVMASGRDVRDMLGLPMGGDGQKSAVQKRAKAAAPVRRIRTLGACLGLRIASEGYWR